MTTEWVQPNVIVVCCKETDGFNQCTLLKKAENMFVGYSKQDYGLLTSVSASRKLRSPSNAVSQLSINSNRHFILLKDGKIRTIAAVLLQFIRI